MVESKLNEALQDALKFYHEYTADAITVSTLEEGDKVRPHLLTEVRAAFTHIAKAMCSDEDDADQKLAQLGDARDHLIRAALDGYKIAIVVRFLKVTKHIKAVEKFTVLGRDIQQEYDACEAARQKCGLTENVQITGNPTVQDYASLYARIYELHELVSARMPENTHKNLAAVARLRAIYSTWSGWFASGFFCLVGFFLAIFWQWATEPTAHSDAPAIEETQVIPDAGPNFVGADDNGSDEELMTPPQ